MGLFNFGMITDQGWMKTEFQPVKLRFETDLART